MSILQKILNRLTGKQAPVLIPDEVNYQQALQWFKNHDAVYERLIKVAAPHIPADGVFFDIGANIGYFSAKLAKKVNFKGKVMLFEPIPNLAAHCKTTFADAPYHAQVHQFALSDAEGSFDIYVARDGNIGWNTMIAEQAAENMERVTIQAKTFAQTGINDEPDFIKIDVEGAEYKVLCGMIPAMQQWQKKPVILCEVGWGKSHPNWQEELAVFRQLEAMGYGIFDLEMNPFDITTLEKTSDILFIPKEN